MATNDLTYSSALSASENILNYEIFNSYLDSQHSKSFAIKLKHISKQSRLIHDKSISNTLISLFSDCNTIKCIDINTLSLICELKGHKNIVTDAIFSHSNSYIIWSSSLDGTTRNWDLRTATQGNILFQSLNEEGFQSVGINIEDNLIAAGCDSIELKTETKSNLYLWDTRKLDIYQVFEETFADSIDNCIFSPIESNILITSCIDGLVYAFDIREKEDNACLYVLNTESSINCLTFIGDEFEAILCAQGDGVIRVWDTLTGNEIRKYPKITDSSGELAGTIVESYYDVISKQIYAICCDNNGNIRILNLLDDGRINLYANLMSGHNDCVRALHWDMTDNSIVSAGEDGMLLLWKAKI